MAQFAGAYAARMSRSGKQTPVPTDRAAQGAHLSLRNARSLLAFAIAGAKTGSYGPAISLIILASEEGAKAMALLFEAVSLKPTGTPITEILSRHQTKHGLSQSMSAMGHLFSLMRQVRDEVQSEVDSGAVDVGRAGSRWVSQAIRELNRLTQEAMNNELRFITWYKDANRLKNAGLYVDWVNGTWHDPNAATEREFDEYRSYVEWWLGIVDSVLAVPVEEWKTRLGEMERVLGSHAPKVE